MPLIIAENRNTEGDGYLLSGNDDIAVEAGITIDSTGASGIATWAGAHVFTINGTVRGYNDGVSMLGTTETCTVIVSATGVAQLTSLRTSLVSGGFLCAVGGIALAGLLPSLWRFDERTDPNAVRERAVRAARAGAESSDPA